MAQTSQDFVKGIDIDALNSVTGSEMEQLVDAGRLASDKGMQIETRDTAEDTPDVPDPNVLLEGVTPVWWVRYAWKRVSFDGSFVRMYQWTPGIDDLPNGMLKWIYQNQTAETALVAANNAQATADDATTIGNNAGAIANTANATAQAVQDDLSDLTTVVENINTRVGNLEAAPSMWPTGSLRHSMEVTVYSTTEDQGWVECDGSSVLKSVFNNLWIALGSPAGVDADHFYLPDLKGRTIIGAGHGAGLSNRVKGDTGGEEAHLLTGEESGIQQHSHPIKNGGSDSGTNTAPDPLDVLTCSLGPENPQANTQTTGHTNALSTHNNMQPFYVARVFIKT